MYISLPSKDNVTLQLSKYVIMQQSSMKLRKVQTRKTVTSRDLLFKFIIYVYCLIMIHLQSFSWKKNCVTTLRSWDYTRKKYYILLRSHLPKPNSLIDRCAIKLFYAKTIYITYFKVYSLSSNTFKKNKRLYLFICRIA